MKEFVEKLIGKLEELRKFEADREDYVDENGHYNDVEEAFDDGESQGRYQAYGRMQKIVNQLAEEYNNGWILLSERLPEKVGRHYLVTSSMNWYNGGSWEQTKYGGTESIKVAYYDITGSFNVPYVIAWQPLPEPYQKGGAE